jgi:hypothetical protein
MAMTTRRGKGCEIGSGGDGEATGAKLKFSSSEYSHAYRGYGKCEPLTWLIQTFLEIRHHGSSLT